MERSFILDSPIAATLLATRLEQLRKDTGNKDDKFEVIDKTTVRVTTKLEEHSGLYALAVMFFVSGWTARANAAEPVIPGPVKPEFEPAAVAAPAKEKRDGTGVVEIPSGGQAPSAWADPLSEFEEKPIDQEA